MSIPKNKVNFLLHTFRHFNRWFSNISGFFGTHEYENRSLMNLFHKSKLIFDCILLDTFMKDFKSFVISLRPSNMKMFHLYHNLSFSYLYSLILFYIPWIFQFNSLRIQVIFNFQWNVEFLTKFQLWHLGIVFENLPSGALNSFYFYSMFI